MKLLVSEEPDACGISVEKAFTCRSKGAKREWIEKVHDYALACNNIKRQISPMEVMEDFESRPHKAVSFVVENENDMQECNEQKLPGYIGGGLPGSCTK